jgi:hypothetical protein
MKKFDMNDIIEFIMIIMLGKDRKIFAHKVLKNGREGRGGGS